MASVRRLYSDLEPGEDFIPDLMYLGNFGSDYLACAEACALEPSCVAYSIITATGTVWNWWDEYQGLCYGRGPDAPQSEHWLLHSYGGERYPCINISTNNDYSYFYNDDIDIFSGMSGDHDGDD